MRRSPIITVLLSIISPGLGQIYNGKLKEGIIFFTIIWFISFAPPFIGLYQTFYGLIFSLLCLTFFFLFIVFNALAISLKNKTYTARKFNKWYLYLLFIMLGSSIVIGTELARDNFSGFKAYRVESASMAPTILRGDFVMMAMNYPRKNKLTKGDVVILRYSTDPKRTVVKRVVGVEGDTLTYKEGSIYINGIPIAKTQTHISVEGFLATKSCSLVLKKGYIFLLGDNQSVSIDSRQWGPIEMKEVKGKALYIYWSWDNVRKKVRWDRIGKYL
jgi:signal peptidase I